MSLELNAAQKTLLKIFKIEEQYIIPMYQRPYSWEYEQCFQLYSDIMENFSSNEKAKSEDYFLGNIIIARSYDNKETLEIVDGQQRVTSLLLMIKVLSIFQQNLTVLTDIIEKRDWEGTVIGFAIDSFVKETNDGENLKKVLSYTKEDFETRYLDAIDNKGNLQEKNCQSRFEANILYFYGWINEYQKSKPLNEFTKYLLNNLFLLPIELSGETKSDARNKALKIFETINNRGMNLEDADIFKAKLYEKAEKIKEEKLFIDSWTKLRDNCDELKIEIDDVFRFYTHIVRGKEGITSNEINLRKFFIEKDYSPLNIKQYKEVLSDLYDIVMILDFIKMETKKETKLGRWLQLIDVYTNQYPKNLLVVYLFKYKKEFMMMASISMSSKNRDENHKFFEEISTQRLTVFAESVVRFAYYHGSTTKIKFEIYNMIRDVSNEVSIDKFYKDLEPSYFDYLGSLKTAYALLAYYADEKIALENYTVDRIIQYKDKDILLKEYNWTENQINEVLNTLGNFIVLDIPKKNLTLSKKLEYLKQSGLKSIQNIVDTAITYEYITQRDLQLKNKLVEFFRGAL